MNTVFIVRNLTCGENYEIYTLHLSAVIIQFADQ